jgi:chemotaxis protein CheC
VQLVDLNEIQIDALREVGGIGAGHAATALSQLVDRAIRLELPALEVMPISEVPSVFGGPEQLVSAVYARLSGDLSGGVLFIADQSTACAIVDLMHGNRMGVTTEIGYDEAALIKHVSTILISSYLAAIARLTHLDVLPVAPALAVDMAGALLEEAIMESGSPISHALFVRTTFVDEANAIDAALFFVPDPGSLDVLLGRLGVL